jgi:hypothetical protein
VKIARRCSSNPARVSDSRFHASLFNVSEIMLKLAPGLGFSCLLLACAGSDSSSTSNTPDSSLDATVDSAIVDETSDVATTDSTSADTAHEADAPALTYGDPSTTSNWEFHPIPGWWLENAVFDGRYVYFPRAGVASASAMTVYRYDTHAAFGPDASWSAFDASSLPSTYWSFGAPAIAPPGIVWGGAGFAAIYDTTHDFISPSSWSKPSIDSSYENDAVGAGSDGTHAYITAFGAPGVSNEQWLFRYGAPSVTPIQIDDIAPLPLVAGIFDGSSRMYFIGKPGLTFDVKDRFDKTSVHAFDTTLVTPSKANPAGGAFDGRYLYVLAPGAGGTLWLSRYDSTAAIDATSSWTALELTAIAGAAFSSYSTGGLAFDGRFLWILIGSSPIAKPIAALRFDTSKTFDSKSWTIVTPPVPPPDAGTYAGFNRAAFDGSYLYFCTFGGVWRFRARDAGTLPAFMPGGTFD